MTKEKFDNQTKKTSLDSFSDTIFNLCWFVHLQKYEYIEWIDYKWTLIWLFPCIQRYNKYFKFARAQSFLIIISDQKQEKNSTKKIAIKNRNLVNDLATVSHLLIVQYSWCCFFLYYLLLLNFSYPYMFIRVLLA